jgi:hypothetical protein
MATLNCRQRGATASVALVLTNVQEFQAVIVRAGRGIPGPALAAYIRTTG